MNPNPVGWPAQLLRLAARLRSDGINSTMPVTEINGGIISAADADIALVAKGAGATLAQVPDGARTGGSRRGARATDWQKSRTSADMVASGADSVIAGGASNAASGSFAFVGGGETNSANTNPYIVVCGGQSNAATGYNASICGGTSNAASGSYSSILGGVAHQGSGAYSSIPGGRQGTTRGINGYFVVPACNIPISNASGVSQAGLLILGRQTTSATSAVLASTSSAASANNQIALPSNSAYSFSGEVIAGVTSGGDTARWTIDGAIKRGDTAASTAMVGTPTVTRTHNDAGAAGWTVAVTADTTNGAIAVTVTGAAATTIRWVAKIETTEMTF